MTGELAQTGARVHRVGRYLGPGPFCLTYGDGLSNVDVSALLRFHRAHGKLVTVTGVRPPSRFGELHLDGRQVTVFAEKPQVTEGTINGGYFVVEREFIDQYLDGRDALTLEGEPLQRAARDGQLMVWPHDGFWQPMDTYREWKLLHDLWNAGAPPWKVWP